MRPTFLPMTDEQRAAMLDALANPIPNPDKPRPVVRAATPGTCDCCCAGCRPWQPFDDAEDYRKRMNRPSATPKHCRHILLCGLGYPDEIELTDADLEEV